MGVELVVQVLLKIPPACLLSGGWINKEEKEEKKDEKNYICLWFCRYSRRLRKPSTEKTITSEANKNRAKIVSMIASYTLSCFLDLRTG